MLFDSHCHLDMEPLKSDQAAVIERSFRAGVVGMINIGSSLRGSRASVEIAENYPNIWASVGVHPHDAETIMNVNDAVEELRALAQSDKVVAVGEIGLDYFVPTGEDRKIDKQKQKNLFEAQLQLARDLNIPVVIHSRDAEPDTIEILRKYPRMKGVVHCYTGSADFAKKLLGLGLFIGFTGFLTFEQPKFDIIRQVLRTVPLDRLLVETDAPFLAPEPYRGKPNEPAFLIEIAKKVAEIKNCTLELVAENTFKNTKLLFNIT